MGLSKAIASINDSKPASDGIMCLCSKLEKSYWTLWVTFAFQSIGAAHFVT
jgi:hypothetical protein